MPEIAEPANAYNCCSISVRIVDQYSRDGISIYNIIELQLLEICATPETKLCDQSIGADLIADFVPELSASEKGWIGFVLSFSIVTFRRCAIEVGISLATFR